MTIQPLISTVDKCFFNRKYTPPFDDYLVINQGNHNIDIGLQERANIFHCEDMGLSKSRNMALRKATADICLISDDDICFLDNAGKITLDAFVANPLADIVTFQTQTPQGHLFKKYHHKKRWHDWLSIMQVTSFEIAFRREKIIASGLQFDERFGLGTCYPTGEENIFLLDALSKGLKILYIPIPIVIHPEENSGNNFNNINLTIGKGAMFYRMFGKKAYLLALLFAIKKYARSKDNFFKFYSRMLQGIKKYKQAYE